jgi:tetratricopeptide (TPR) repeat protein
MRALALLILAGSLFGSSLLDDGTALFNAGEYEKAIEPLQRALDSEKHESRLAVGEWRGLVVHLASAYRKAGKLTAAEEVLQYAIARDAKCPTCYFTLAAIYGDWNKVYVAIKWLKLALENRENLAPGEVLPDPRKEATFQRFMKNDDFRALRNAFPEGR